MFGCLAVFHLAYLGVMFDSSSHQESVSIENIAVFHLAYLWVMFDSSSHQESVSIENIAVFHLAYLGVLFDSSSQQESVSIENMAVFLLPHLEVMFDCSSQQSVEKKGKRKVQGVPQSQTAALPRHQEEEETQQNQSSTNRTKVWKALRLALFPKWGNRNAKRTEKHKVRHKTNRLVE